MWPLNSGYAFFSFQNRPSRVCQMRNSSASGATYADFGKIPSQTNVESFLGSHVGLSPHVHAPPSRTVDACGPSKRPSSYGLSAWT